MMNPDIIAAYVFGLGVCMTLPIVVAIIARTIRQAVGGLYTS